MFLKYYNKVNLGRAFCISKLVNNYLANSHFLIFVKNIIKGAMLMNSIQYAAINRDQ
jgi:hypothetical protein